MDCLPQQETILDLQNANPTAGIYMRLSGDMASSFANFINETNNLRIKADYVVIWHIPGEELSMVTFYYKKVFCGHIYLMPKEALDRYFQKL